MPIDIPLGTETAGYTITIDGRTYRPVLVDSSGRLYVLGIGTGGAVEVVQDTPADLKAAAHGLDGSTQRQLVVDSSGRLVLAEMTSVFMTASVVVPTAVETTILTITGAGVCQWFQWITAHDDVELRVLVDGTLAFAEQAGWLSTETMDHSTHPLILLAFTDGATCRGIFAGPWHFKTSFVIKAYHTTGSDKLVEIARGVCSTY